MTTQADRAVNRTGVYLAVLQLVFTLGWTTYLIYLPKLCADVGIAPSTVILILMMDQGIFTVTDTAMGMAADRIASLVGRLGLFVGILAAISCVDANRAIGWRAMNAARAAAGSGCSASRPRNDGVSVVPGQMALQRMPRVT